MSVIYRLTTSDIKCDIISYYDIGYNFFCPSQIAILMHALVIPATAIWIAPQDIEIVNKCIDYQNTQYFTARDLISYFKDWAQNLNTLTPLVMY